MNITVVVSKFRAGGAERVAANLANYWARKGHLISVLTFDDGCEEPFYDLHRDVHHRPLGIAGELRGILDKVIQNVKRIIILRREIRRENPDVVIGVMSQTNVRVILAARSVGVPVVVNEQIFPGRQQLDKVWARMRLFTYPFSNRLVGASGPIIDYFPKSIRRIGKVIGNPVDLRNIDTEEVTSHDGEKGGLILAMGRLEPQKGFDLLLNAFAKFAKVYPNWRLEIWGEGKERASLVTLRDELNLSRQVTLPGLTKKPFNKMKEADFFVLSSRFEGFGNVLIEAMACGLPVVSFDCPSGPSEIVTHNEDGLLISAEDVSGLAESMLYMMKHPEKRQLMGKQAAKIQERFGIEEIGAQWDMLLNEIIAENGRM